MNPHIDLAINSSVPVIFYDQIGSARSSHIAPAITIDLFIAELTNLIDHLKISAFNIVGHSWGGVLGVEYAIRVQPPDLNTLS
ncbi:hypothetical protein C8R41DRAFT_774843 [Lentinula lateritia]|uniref:AB hydrolase-1 domain-containing protein n=1 Tax=Lentinula lateritia TaxID=40482 RepID=A0ABQ8VAV8_9AGAR|nr:hypothetical protein C8R41DRAFT_774843 [Lentinula lateritia]